MPRGGLRNPPGGRPRKGLKKLVREVPESLHATVNAMLDKALKEYENQTNTIDNMRKP